MHDYIIDTSTIRECNFAMGTIILGKGLAQALVHTVHSTRAFGTCACGKPFPKIVPMAKLDILHLCALCLLFGNASVGMLPLHPTQR